MRTKLPKTLDQLIFSTGSDHLGHSLCGQYDQTLLIHI